MFIAAAGIAYAKRFNKEICLNKPFNPAFNIPFRICTQEEVDIANKKSCLFKRFSPEVLKKDDCNILEDDYYQNELFFADQADLIREVYSFKKPVPKNLIPLTKEMEEKNSVAIHIRRGDYVFHKYPIMSLSYYEAGADYIQSNTNKPIHLYVFSDDIPWVKANFKSKYPFTIIEGNKNTVDLQLMTLCHHNIIANSTFSWWGAWLNNHPDKIIIAPDKWDPKREWWKDDIIPKDWIILPANDDKDPQSTEKDLSQNKK